MTNLEMVAKYKMMNGIDLKTDLLSFQEWKKRGYSVKKGETSHHKLDLWKRCKVEEEGENREKIERHKFILRKTALFEIGQVEPLKRK